MKLQCPHCHESFQADENAYAAIAAQVKNAEFEREISRRMNEINTLHEAEEKTRRLENQRKNEADIAAKEADISKLEAEIARLKSQLDSADTRRRADLSTLEANHRTEIEQLNARLASKDHEREMAVQQERNAQLNTINANNNTIVNLRHQLENERLAANLQLDQIKQIHDNEIRIKDEQIQQYRDFKLRLSTKMLGETLEQHCFNTFNRARSQGLFANAYFNKDNDTSIDNSKGDFIFRDYIDGREYISIMFEMKNEADATATKHRNEDFFKKLHKDRTDKGCEYAVLVSMLEADNELYNEGIVDVSYQYDKMFVVRPQFFLAVIAMLTKASRTNALKINQLEQQLTVAKSQSIDVTNFEDKVDKIKTAFKKYTDTHIKKQNEAIETIDKTIAALETQINNLRKARAAFENSEKNINKANDSLENDLTVKKLTRGNPTMKELFEQAHKTIENE